MSQGVRLQRLLLLVAAMALATIALGWWAPLLIALVFAVIDGYASVPSEAGISAALAWAILFMVNALIPGVGIMGVVGRAMGLPSIALPLVTILFPALLAWSGATVVVALSTALGRPRRVRTGGAEPGAVLPDDART